MGVTQPGLHSGHSGSEFGHSPPSRGRFGAFLNRVGPFWVSKCLDGGVLHATMTASLHRAHLWGLIGRTPQLSRPPFPPSGSAQGS